MSDINLITVIAICGFLLWGGTGWVVGQIVLKRQYIKSNAFVNIKLMRQIEDDNFNLNQDVNELKTQVLALEDHNKRLWAWNFSPHSEASFINITQYDKHGDEVASSQISLPDRKHWVEPLGYADDLHEDYHKWKEGLDYLDED